MVQVTLEISRVPGAVPPLGGQNEIGAIRGGPEQLLQWLEIQLGLGPTSDSFFVRTARYVRQIDAAEVQEIAPSLVADRWETAAALLKRRDALRIGGWDGDVFKGAPPEVQAIVAVEEAANERGEWRDAGGEGRSGNSGGANAEKTLERKVAADGESERLDAVIAALDAGQVLPAHRVVLLEAVDQWPRRWRWLFRRLNCESRARLVPHAPQESSLGHLQQAVLAGQVADVVPNESVAWLDVATETSAVELVGAILSKDKTDSAQTVIACSDPFVRLRLEHRLAALRLPTAGVRFDGHAGPVFQVLPLAIDMCRRPVSPELLLDFLQLPISPLPKFAARRLAQALADQPGLGSERWQEAWQEVCSPEADPDGTVRETLQAWLPWPSSAGGEGEWTVGDDPMQESDAGNLPVLRVCCASVAQWARDEAALVAALRPHCPPPLAAVLQDAAEQAEQLAELLQEELDDPRGLRTLDRHQVLQWIAASRKAARELQPFEREAGSVRIVTSPDQVRQSYDRLIWLGGRDEPRAAFPWSGRDVEVLREAGIEVDTPEKEQRSRVWRQRDGVALARQSCVLVRLPSSDQSSESSIWTHLEACLRGPDGARRAATLRELVDETISHPAVPIRSRTAHCERPQPARSMWELQKIPPRREHRSVTEMTEHLACPLRWVLRRLAEISPAGNVRLPAEMRLAGTFSHQVLRRALEPWRPEQGPAEMRRRVLDIFDSRVGLDAAPLAEPTAAATRGRVRAQLGGATERLVRLLQAGGYVQTAMEVPFELSELSGDDEADPEAMVGTIDCLATRADGRELVIDFKLGGDARWREAILQGRAVQLATYAHSRYRVTGQYPAVAYLVLATAQLFTPRRSRPVGMREAECESGPPIESVWDAFRIAVETTSGWSYGERPVPCRPLQAPDEWPSGSELVLDPPSRNPSRDAVQPICRYCDYGSLCGRVSLV